MKRILFLLLAQGLICSSFSQSLQNNKTAFLSIKVPDSLTVSTTSLSNYFKQKYVSDSDRVKAIFTWVATNIQYDVDNMFALSYGENKDEKIDRALKTRAAVCEGYAEVFNEVCNKAGIQSMIITGYTKQKGMIDYIPHAWVASKVDNEWHLFDPTWSSGAVSDKKFVKGFTYRYYKVKPEELIKTHMPFDPMEQFLKQPLTTKAFYDGNFTPNTSGTVFNFEDSLARHASLSQTDRLRNAVRRIEANGVRSSMIMQMLQYLKNKELNIQTDLLNAASTKANDGVIAYNLYIEYKNKQFIPRRKIKRL